MLRLDKVKNRVHSGGTSPTEREQDSMTIRQTILGIICRFKPHTDRRVTVSRTIERDSGDMVEHYAARECVRCGRLVPVRMRGPRKTKGAQ